MIKAVIFDVGGVLIDESGRIARELIATKYGFSSEKFSEYTKDNLKSSYRGELNALDFFNGLIEKLNLKNVDAETLRDEWLEIRRKSSVLKEGVVGVAERLNEKGIVLGILSNTTKLNEMVDVRKDLYKMFDVVVLSCDVGVAKPERAIYEILVSDLWKKGIDVDEVIFVDNDEENLRVAEEMGMKTIRFVDIENLVKRLDWLGVVI